MGSLVYTAVNFLTLVIIVKLLFGVNLIKVVKESFKE